MNGIFIPWSVVVIAIVLLAIRKLPLYLALCRGNRVGASAIGTMSVSLGIGAFAFLLVTHVPYLGSSVVASEESSAEKSVEKNIEPDTKEATKSDAKSPGTSEPKPRRESTSESISAAAQSELNSPIATTIKIDYERRPSWVETVGQQEGGVYRVAVSSGPWATKAECEKELNVKLKKATDEYVRDFLQSDFAPQRLDYNLAFIKKNLVREQGTYQETVTVSFGQMRQIHMLLEFDESFRRQLTERWQHVIVGSRLGQTGLAFMSVLALIGTFFWYFKLDHATRGFYTGRLQFGMAVAILVFVATGIFLARTFPWL